MDQFALYTHSFHNCRGLVLSAMLLRLGVPIGYVWHQSGLVYQQDAQGSLLIDPYYQDVIENDHGVKWSIEHYEDWNVYLQRIYHLLDSGHTIAVAADVHEIPYSMYYKHHHESHTIELVGREDNGLVVADHTLRFFGKVEVDALKAAINAYYIHIHQGDYGLLYVDAINVPRAYTRNDLLQAVTENCLVMEGHRLHNLCHAPLSAKIGMEALTATIHKIEEVMQQDIERIEDQLDQLFSFLREIAQSRHLFHEYLKLFQEETLANEFHEISQNMLVASHILIRAKVQRNLSLMLPRVMKRLSNAQEKEQQGLQLMRSLLECV